MKVCFITGTRAEYGLLKPLIDELSSDDFFEVQIIATGMHLSPEFGLTFKEIEKDGLKIDEKIEILLSSDTSIGISKAMGLAIISFSETYQRLIPDLIIGLGDRFELFSAVASAMVSRIPVAHIHGGEVTSGAYDDSFRHSITKMSHLHFTSTEIYKKRVIQLGENPQTVFNVGALGLDNIKKMKLLTKKKLERLLNISLAKPYFVVTFHPTTLENQTSERQIKELLLAFDEFKSYQLIFTKSNADNDGRIINDMIDDYVSKNVKRAISFFSLGQLKYLSALKYAEMIIGNSSSGILEAPFFKKPTVNIGERQKGRIFSNSVIQCVPNKKSIINAINKGLNKKFKLSITKQPNIFGNGNAALNIKNYLLKMCFDNLIKKEFYDIPFNIN